MHSNGSSNKGRTPLDIVAIPPNVRNYLAILALDADGGNFSPTDRHDIKLLAPKSQYGKAGNPDSLNPCHIKPNVHFLPMPGNHSDLVNAKLSSPLVDNSAKLCRHLGGMFLTAHGSAMKQSFQMAADEIMASYNQMLTQLSAIAKAASTGGWLSPIEGFKTERAVRKHRAEYVHEPDKYINEHHRLCTLQENYPSPSVEDVFSQHDWVEKQEDKLLDLPKEQTNLRKMGITVS